MISSCPSRQDIINTGGKIIENSDGSVNVYYSVGDNFYPQDLSMACCKAISPTYFFNIDTQTCKWAEPKSCLFNEPIKLILNPKGNDGSMFFVEDFDKEDCTLDIKLDYLFKIKCEDLLTLSTQQHITTIVKNNAEIVGKRRELEKSIYDANIKVGQLETQIANLQAQNLRTAYSVTCTTIQPQFPQISTINTNVWNQTAFTGRTRPSIPSIPTISNDSFGPLSDPNNVVGWGTPVTPVVTGRTPSVLISGVGTIPIRTTPTDILTLFQPINTNQNESFIVPSTNTSQFARSSISTQRATTTITTIPISTTSFQRVPISISNPPLVQINASNNYCFTQTGLDAWAIKLGRDRYGRFLNGDATSYNCREVTAFLQSNPNDIYSCRTPFGAKTKIINNINILNEDLTKSKAVLDSLENQLISLKDEIEIVVSETSALCSTPVKALENLDISLLLEIVNNDNTLTTITSYPLFSPIENLYTYLTKNTNSGFYICGDPSSTDTGLTSCTSLSLDIGGTGAALADKNVYSCNAVASTILRDLFTESGLNTYSDFEKVIPNNSLQSNWLTFEKKITDQNIITLIKNRKIKLSIKIENSCLDLCVLLDNIVLDKHCVLTDFSQTVITKSPGFDFTRVIDNKKSWIDINEPSDRQFLVSNHDDTKRIRQTDYHLNDEKLILNSKEIDLDINVASAIETDVWCYLNDNPALLTGETECSPCLSFKSFQDDGDFIFQDSIEYGFQGSDGTGKDKDVVCCGDNKINFIELLTTDLSSITTIEGFDNLLISELIDAKNRKTISSYATLRALYDRYMNSTAFTNTVSSKFDYVSMDKFAGLIGNYWIDIIEQVVPSTSIWGSVKIYTNTAFDQQKFKYKEYSSLICNTEYDKLTLNNQFTGYSDTNVEVITKGKTRASTTKCDFIGVKQFNVGSEFVGGIKIVKNRTAVDIDKVSTLVLQPRNGYIPRNGAFPTTNSAPTSTSIRAAGPTIIDNSILLPGSLVTNYPTRANSFPRILPVITGLTAISTTNTRLSSPQIITDISSLGTLPTPITFPTMNRTQFFTGFTQFLT